ncbi:MAG: adenylate/guanylate cyclase domain-containing protein, partial [Desulfobacterales bacterium]|nr:adenylate/guanylate cyclase domain-containing protein [Desulfobacterales bacterium]
MGSTAATFPTDSERKQVTVMFSDLSGYTAMTERLDPEEVKGIMSLIFREFTRIIKDYDGFIEKFIGDAVMAVFGVPKAHEDDPIRAIKAAMEMRTAVKGISPQFEEKIGSPLNIHTGINTGLVVTGEVDIEKGTHGLTGDAINLASRLENIAKMGEIIVGPDTYSRAVNFFEFEVLTPA